MRIWPVALALFTLTPLAAQDWEAGLLVGRQSFDSIDFTLVGVNGRVQPDARTVVALRAGYSVLDLQSGTLQVSAMFQPSTSSTGKVTLGAASATLQTKFKTQQFGLGAMYNFNTPVALGAGLDLRAERLSGTSGDTSVSTNLVRPWLRLNAGYVFATASTKPFIKFELAAPLYRKNIDFSSADSADVLRGMAPKLQAGIYVGLNF